MCGEQEAPFVFLFRALRAPDGAQVRAHLCRVPAPWARAVKEPREGKVGPTRHRPQEGGFVASGDLVPSQEAGGGHQGEPVLLDDPPRAGLGGRGTVCRSADCIGDAVTIDFRSQ